MFLDISKISEPLLKIRKCSGSLIAYQGAEAAVQSSIQASLTMVFILKLWALINLRVLFWKRRCNTKGWELKSFRMEFWRDSNKNHEDQTSFSVSNNVHVWTENLNSVHYWIGKVGIRTCDCCNGSRVCYITELRHLAPFHWSYGILTLYPYTLYISLGC